MLSATLCLVRGQRWEVRGERCSCDACLYCPTRTRLRFRSKTTSSPDAFGFLWARLSVRTGEGVGYIAGALVGPGQRGRIILSRVNSTCSQFFHSITSRDTPTQVNAMCSRLRSSGAVNLAAVETQTSRTVAMASMMLMRRPSSTLASVFSSCTVCCCCCCCSSSLETRVWHDSRTSCTRQRSKVRLEIPAELQPAAYTMFLNTGVKTNAGFSCFSWNNCTKFPQHC